MRIGVPREVKAGEGRVSLVPCSVRELVRAGHFVLVEAGAGRGACLSDQLYIDAGAQIAENAEELFAEAELIVKVKEPLAEERKRLREGQILFAYLHLAPDMEQARDLLESGAVCIAYETVTGAHGSLPLLLPMSTIAGRLAPQVGASALQANAGGRGVLLGGALGVPPADVVIIGGGVVGANAALIALGMGAAVTVVDCSARSLLRLEERFGSRLHTSFSTHENILRLLQDADLVIGAVLVSGTVTPSLVTAEMLKEMKQGSVLVDISIDQGGCFETSRATTHSDPTYLVDGVLHYCVPNMPGAVPCTSSFSLSHVVLPFVRALADKGYRKALSDDPHLRRGLHVCKGRTTIRSVADAQGLEYSPPEHVLAL